MSLSTALPALAVAAEVLLQITIAMVIVGRRRGTPAVRLAWLVIVFALPLVGVALYLLVGEVRLGRRRVARHGRIVQRISVQATAAAAAARPAQIAALVPNELVQVAHLIETVGGNRPHGGHALRLYGATDLFIQALIEDIAAAQAHCHLEFYIFLADHSGTRIAEALIAAAGRGVGCRLLVDGVGSHDFLRSPLRRRLNAAGVRVVEALPASLIRMAFARVDLRNHRKIAVIDGLIGYTGSQNIADAEFAMKPSYAPWVDVMVRMEGPAVHDLQVIFVTDWYQDTDESLEELLAIRPAPAAQGATVQVVASGPDCYIEAMHQMSQACFHLAREELILTTPYYVPDEATAAALYTTARRGVETTLIVPARNDSPMVAAASRSYYDTLLEAGVNLFEFQAGLLHAKTMTVDRRFALVTSANLDRRSFELNFEVSLAVYDSDFASEIRFLQKSYLDESARVDASSWRRRGWPTRLWQNGMGMLSPLL